MKRVLFIELPKFAEAIADLLPDDCFAGFQLELARNPKRGKVMPGCSGLRKVRLRLPGRGKSGGARVIYLHLEEQETIVLVYVYTKAASENLTVEQKGRLRLAAEIIKREFKR